MIERTILEKVHGAQRQGQANQELLARRLLEDFRTHAREGLKDIPLTDPEANRIVSFGQPEPKSNIDKQGLSTGEICVYDALTSHPGQIVPFDTLIEDCLTERGNKTALYSTVSRLRRRVPEVIANVRGQGFVITISPFSSETSHPEIQTPNDSSTSQ